MAYIPKAARSVDASNELGIPKITTCRDVLMFFVPVRATSYEMID